MSFEFHINGNQTTLFILFVLRSCTFGFADYIMLEDIKENMLGEKHESLLDENKMLRELLKSALDENKKFCEDLELKQKEVDSYKKMNIEGYEE